MGEYMKCSLRVTQCALVEAAGASVDSATAAVTDAARPKAVTSMQSRVRMGCLLWLKAFPSVPLLRPPGPQDVQSPVGAQAESARTLDLAGDRAGLQSPLQKPPLRVSRGCCERTCQMYDGTLAIAAAAV